LPAPNFCIFQFYFYSFLLVTFHQRLDEKEFANWGRVSHHVVCLDINNQETDIAHVLARIILFFSLDASDSANEQRPFGVDSIQRPLLLTAEKNGPLKPNLRRKKVDENFHSK
jgi:hypothetical protein